MNEPAAPIIPVLDKSYLFVHLLTDPQNQNGKYLQCPATGHLYCISTGSLYQKILPITPLSTNISSILQGKDSCLLPRIPPPCTMKAFSVYEKNIERQDIGASSTLSTERNVNPKVKVIDQSIPGNSAPSSQSNKTHNVKNSDQCMQGNSISTIPDIQGNITPKVKLRDQPIQGNNANKSVQVNRASSISKTTSKVKHASQTIQCNSPSQISHMQCNTSPNAKKADQPIQGISASITANTQRNKASESKGDTSTKATSPVPGANCNSDPTTKKKTKTRNKKPKDSKKKPASSKQKKCTVPPQTKPTTFFTKNSSSFKNTASITQTAKQHEASIHSNKMKKTKKTSYTYYQFYLHHTIKLVQPMQINFEDILHPQNVTPTFHLPGFSRKCAKKNTEIIPVCSLPKPQNNRPRKYKKRKPTLHFTREDEAMMYLENFKYDFIKKTTKKKKILCQSLLVSKIFEIY